MKNIKVLINRFIIKRSKDNFNRLGHIRPYMLQVKFDFRLKFFSLGLFSISFALEMRMNKRSNQN